MEERITHKPYYDEGNIQIYHGDCQEVMKGFDDNSVDTIITDIPYGLEFMGKEWDSFSNNTNSALGGQSPANKKKNTPFKSRGKPIRGWCEKDKQANINFQKWNTKWAKEALRVAKPGAMMLAFGGDRTHHRLMVGIEDAGWEIRTCIYWLFGSGFPKSLDIGKAIDKRNYRFFDDNFKSYCNEKRRELGLSLHTINQELGTALTGGGFASCIMGNKTKNELPTVEMYKKLKVLLGLDNRYDELIERIEAEREIIGESKSTYPDNHLMASNFAQGKTTRSKLDITAPATPEAQLWEGWGTALKPAAEIIVVAMKPLDGTFAENALKHGVAGLNIDGGRVEYQDDYDKSQATPQGKCTSKELGTIGATPDAGRNLERIDFNRPEQKGRWPANVIHDGSDEVVGLFPETKSGARTGASSVNKNRIFKLHGGKCEASQGSAARFFYCAKASKAERNAGCEGLEEKELGHNRFDKCTNCGGYIFQNPDRKSACKCKNPIRQHNRVKGNHHPTVKPLKLMEYLCKLTMTPTGGVVLDPFAGSCTTGIACHNTGRGCIMIERDIESCEIGGARFKHWVKQMKQDIFQWDG